MTNLVRQNSDNLIGQNPRDSIILLREKRLQKIREEKKAKALGFYDAILRKYSKQFFKDETMFDQLNPLQKKELAKFCASYCRRWSACLFLPLGLSLFAILSFGFFSVSSWFFILLPWAVVSLISVVAVGVSKDQLEHANIEHFWPFLKAHKKLNQSGKKTTKEDNSGSGSEEQTNE